MQTPKQKNELTPMNARVLPYGPVASNVHEQIASDALIWRCSGRSRLLNIEPR